MKTINYKITKIVTLIIIININIFFPEIKNNKIDGINKIINKSILNESKDVLNKQYINVSVIIPVYNCENTINSSILSIQQQNLTNLEIILVNDYSKDKSLNIIETFMKNDSRIKLINNKKNYGTLYSRSIGALSAKGAYIFSLDNDDEFFGKDSFDYIYKQAIEGNHDIIYFKKIYVRNKKKAKLRLNNINFISNKSYIVHQPELSIFPISKNGRFFENSFFIWDKCIKTDLYQKAVHLIENEIKTHQISYNEDIIIIFIIFSISKSMKIINQYGIIHYIYKTSTSRTRKRDYKIYCNIFFLDILFRFSKNNSHKNLCVEYFLRNWNFINKTTSKYIYSYLIQILNKIINDTYITKKNKAILNKTIEDIETKIK